MKQLCWFLLTLSLILVGCQSKVETVDIAATQSSTPIPPPSTENSDLLDEEPRPPDCESSWFYKGTSYSLTNDGRWLAYRTNQFDLIVTEIDTTGQQPAIPFQPILSIPHPGQFSFLQWSPDNQILAHLSYDLGGYSRIQLFDVENPDRRVAHPYESVDHFIWSPDGQMIAYSSQLSDQLKVSLYDLGNDQTTLLTTTGFHRPISWSPDGQFLALESSHDGYNTSFIEIIDIVTQQSTILTEGELCEARPVWSPDGQKIAYLTQTTPEFDKRNWDLFLLDLTTGERQQLTSTFDAREENLVWSPDGQQLAVTASHQSTDKLIFTIDIETNEIIELLIETADTAPLPPQWFPDSEHLLVETYSPKTGALQLLDVLNVNTLERTSLVQFP